MSLIIKCLEVKTNRKSKSRKIMTIDKFITTKCSSFFPLHILPSTLPLPPNKQIDLSDNDEHDSTAIPSSVQTSVANSESHQQAMSYTLAAQAAAVAASGVKSSVSEQEQQSLSSTETLLRNIQSLLTVAADNARQQERQISYEKGKCQAATYLLFFFYSICLKVHSVSSGNLCFASIFGRCSVDFFPFVVGLIWLKLRMF